MIKTLYIDIMVGDLFYSTVQYPYYPSIPIDIDQLTDYIEKKLPTLRRGTYHVVIDESKTITHNKRAYEKESIIH